MPKTQMLAQSTDKTHFTATLQSTGLYPHKEPVPLWGGAL